MVDETTGDGQSAEAVTPAPAAPQDGFDAALKEYDEANVKPDTSPAPASDPATRAQETREQLDAVRQLGELRQWAVGVEGERLARREKEDADWVIAQGNKIAAEFDNLPTDFAERWLRAEYSIDPELHHAWDNRYESADAMRWCKRCVRHALDRLRGAALKVPDAETTSTKAAIGAAMLRGGSGKPPPSGPPNYSQMTDGEFRDAVKKEHGYTPL